MRAFCESIVLFTLCVSLAACTKSSDGDGADKPTASGSGFTESQGRGKEPTVGQLGGPRDALVIAYQSDADSFLPVVEQSVGDQAINGNLYYPSMDSTFDCRITYTPATYESWTWNDDHTQLTAKVRKGLKWFDGQDVTAKDMKFVIDLVSDPEVASPRVSSIKNLDPQNRIELVDSHTVRYNFTHAYDEITMLAHAAFTPHPEHALASAERSSLRGHKLNRDPIINGPWKMAKREPSARIVLEPNEKFTGPEKDKPRLKRVIFKILPEYATRLVELESGKVDFMEAILVEDADRLAKEHSEIKLYRRGWRFLDYIAWNHFDPEDYTAKQKSGGAKDWSKIKPHPLFGDKRVRRALTKAIDVNKLIADLLTSKETGEKYGRPAVSTLTPELCDYRIEDEIKTIGFNQEEAKRELAEAGWKDTDGDGILDKDGKKFSFTLTTNSGNARRAKSAIIIQSNLKDVGVDMQIEQIETNTFFESLRKKNYAAALAGWSAGLFVDMSVIWHSGEDYEFNFVGFNSPEADAAMEAALKEPDLKKNAELWKKVQRIIYEEQPYTFLFWRDEIVGLHSRFKDAKVDVLSALNDMNTWWVPENEVKYKR